MEPLTALYGSLQSLGNWQKDALQECINDVSAQFDINMGKIAQPLRVAVTGGSMSPSIDVTLFLLGKHRVLARLDEALEKIKKRASA